MAKNNADLHYNRSTVSNIRAATRTPKKRIHVCEKIVDWDIKSQNEKRKKK